MLTALFVLALVLAVFAAVPFVRHDAWWVRVFDFPRLQIAALALVPLTGAWFFAGEGWMFYATVALATFAFGVELAQIIPYTPLWPKEVQPAEGGNPTVKLLIANVLMSNREADGLLRWIRAAKPDVVILDEPDAWWEDRFRAIEEDYPHVVRDARDNTYGMLLYSRRAFVEAEKRTIVEDDIPSMHVCFELDGQRIRLHAIHPKPPYPKEATTTKERDAELIIVGRLAATEPDPTIVAGDLNDVAWSHTTRLFQKVSGLLDPRRGRGMFNTFHAKVPFLRFPLDHVFHSDHFRLVRLERGPGYGSDHFPILVELELDPDAQDEQEAPALDADAAEEADETVEKAKG